MFAWPGEHCETGGGCTSGGAADTAVGVVDDVGAALDVVEGDGAACELVADATST